MLGFVEVLTGSCLYLSPYILASYLLEHLLATLHPVFVTNITNNCIHVPSQNSMLIEIYI